MGISFFRPWGELNWLLNKLDPVKWDLLGCISFEERCTSALEILKNADRLASNRFITIIDPLSDVTETIEKKIKESEKFYTDLVGLNQVNIVEKKLFSPNSEIVASINNFFDGASDDVILDITCFPKRFFFPFIKLALKNPKIKNLIISYGGADTYASSDLSTDPEPWGNIPLFGPIDYPEPEPKHAFVGVGFIPFGLSNLLKDRYSNIPVTFFFPFPPGSQFHNRSWEF